jgi:chemotaxis protein CheY-P-specific phosphatase CheC
MNEDRKSRFGRLMASAASRACSALSELLHDEVVVGESHVYDDISRDALMERLRGHDDQVTISQSAFGAEPVKVSLVVDGSQVRPLLQVLMGRHGTSIAREDTNHDGAVIDTIEADALRELASVITGSCARVLAGELGLKGLSLPSMPPHTSLEDKVCWLLPDARSMCAEAELKARGSQLKIELMISLDPETGVKHPSESLGGKARVEDEPADARRMAVRPERT